MKSVYGIKSTGDGDKSLQEDFLVFPGSRHSEPECLPFLPSMALNGPALWEFCLFGGQSPSTDVNMDLPQKSPRILLWSGGRN
jgi:hypothetical protein